MVKMELWEKLLVGATLTGVAGVVVWRSGLLSRVSGSEEHSQSSNPPQIDNEEVIAARLEQLRRLKPNTYVINPKVSTPVRGRYEVLNIRGTGQLKEFMVRSDVVGVTVHVMVDGGTLYEDTWTELSAISQPVGEVAAFRDENGKYVIHLEDIDFHKELIVRLYGIFNAERLFLKYDLYPPRGRRFIPLEDEKVKM